MQVGLFEPSDVAAVPDDDASVVCLSAPGEGRECVEVARVVLAHAERGTPFDRIAVVMRAPELYASHLETALRRADVPVHFGRGTRRPDPAGRAMLALLACAVEGLSARRFAEYLSLGQVPALPGTGSRESGVGTGSRDSGVGSRESLATVLPDEAEALGLRLPTIDADTRRRGRHRRRCRRPMRPCRGARRGAGKRSSTTRR